MTTATQNLDALRLPKLQALFAETTGKTTRSPNKKYLIRKIREALDSQATEIIEEDAAIEKMQAATEPAKPAKATKTKKSKRSKKAAPAVETTTETSATEQETEASATETDAEPNPTTHQDVPTAEEIETVAEATEMAANDSTPDDTAETTTESQDDEEKPLRKLTIPELQARYLEVVGRPTGSSHRRYLIWKVREAQKGRVPVGPRTRRSPGEPAPEYKILPFRMESQVVDRLDAARERMGLKSRMDLFRHALASYLDKNGETDLAAAITTQI